MKTVHSPSAYIPRLIVWCYHALFLITPFLFTWVNSELFEFNKMLFVFGIATTVGGLWTARMILEKRIIWNKHPIGLLALIFLVGQGIATLSSIHFRTGLFGYYSRLNGGFFSSLAYVVLVLGLLSNVPRKHMWSLLLTHVLAAVMVSLYAIPEHFGISPSCLLMRGEPNTDCWKQDVQARVFATFGQPNWLATYLVGILPFAWLFSKKYTGKQRLIWLIGTGLMVLTLWYTKSRSGLIAAGIAGAGVAIFSSRTWWHQKLSRIFRARQAWLGGWIIFAGLFITTALAYQLVTAARPHTFDLTQGTESGSIRLIVWQGALKVWQRYPWTGSGPGTFAYSFYKDRPAEHNLVSEWDNLYNKAHNEFLNYLAETGMVGFLTYTVFLGGTVWLLWKQDITSAQKWSVYGAAAASVIGITTAHFFGFSIVMTNVLLFLLPTIVFLPDEGEFLVKRRPFAPWQKGGLALTTLFCLFILFQLLSLWRADWWYTRGRKLQESGQYAAGVTALQKAYDLQPAEPLFSDELADFLAQAAYHSFQAGETDATDGLMQAAIGYSDYALSLNPRHLNFYKTRVRMFFFLSEIDARYLVEAERTLKAAILLAPTDAQLWYNLGIIQQQTGQFSQAAETLHHAVDLKPNYIRARSELGDLLVQLGRVEEGREQYRFILEKLSPTDTLVQEKLRGLDQPSDQTIK